MPVPDIGSLALNAELVLFPTVRKWSTSLSDCKPSGILSFNYSLVPLPNNYLHYHKILEIFATGLLCIPTNHEVGSSNLSERTISSTPEVTFQLRITQKAQLVGFFRMTPYLARPCFDPLTSISTGQTLGSRIASFSEHHSRFTGGSQEVFSQFKLAL